MQMICRSEVKTIVNYCSLPIPHCKCSVNRKLKSIECEKASHGNLQAYKNIDTKLQGALIRSSREKCDENFLNGYFVQEDICIR